MKTLRRVMLTFALATGASTALYAQASPPQPAKPAFDAAGSYELQVTFSGQATPIALELIKDKDGWRGTAGNQALGTATVSGFKQDGRTLTINLAADNAAFVMTVTVKEDNTVTGKWEGNGDGSPLTGKKTK